MPRRGLSDPGRVGRGSSHGTGGGGAAATTSRNVEPPPSAGQSSMSPPGRQMSGPSPAPVMPGWGRAERARRSVRHRPTRCPDRGPTARRRLARRMAGWRTRARGAQMCTSPCSRRDGSAAARGASARRTPSGRLCRAAAAPHGRQGPAPCVRGRSRRARPEARSREGSFPPLCVTPTLSLARGADALAPAPTARERARRVRRRARDERRARRGCAGWRRNERGTRPEAGRG